MASAYKHTLAARATALERDNRRLETILAPPRPAPFAGNQNPRSFDRCATCGIERRASAFRLARNAAGDRVRICRTCTP